MRFGPDIIFDIIDHALLRIAGITTRHTERSVSEVSHRRPVFPKGERILLSAQLRLRARLGGDSK